MRGGRVRTLDLLVLHSVTSFDKRDLRLGLSGALELSDTGEYLQH